MHEEDIYGTVVEHKENGIRFAVARGNFIPEQHKRVRALKSHESYRTYQPRYKGAQAGKPLPAETPGTETGDTSTPSTQEGH